MKENNFKQTESQRHLKFSIKISNLNDPQFFNPKLIKPYLNQWYTFLKSLNQEHLDQRFFKYNYQFQNYWVLILRQAVSIHNVFLADESESDFEPYDYHNQFWIEVHPYHVDENGQTIINYQIAHQVEVVFYRNEYEGFASPFGIKNAQAVFDQLAKIDREYLAANQ